MTDLQITSIILSLAYIFFTGIAIRRLPQPVSLIFLLYSSIFFLTHHAQGTWILYNYELELVSGFYFKEMGFLDNQIMLNAMILNFVFFIMVLVPIFLSKKHLSYILAKKDNFHFKEPSIKRPYFFRLYFIVILSLILNKIGFYNLVNQPGFNFTAGITTYLVLLYVVEFYLLVRINTRSLSGLDYLSLLGTCFVLLFTSRAMLVIFMLTIFLTIFRPVRSIKWTQFLYLVIAVWLVMIMYGIYRHMVTTELHGVELNIDFYAFLTNFKQQIDWIMFATVEGFSGTASTLEEILSGDMSYDFGLTFILSIFKVIPSMVYNIFDIDYLTIFKENVYVGNSVIPGIVESSLLQFGLFGVPILGLGTGILIVIFGRRLIVNFNLLSIVVVVSLIYSIRGGIIGLTLLIVSYILMLFLFHLINRLKV